MKKSGGSLVVYALEKIGVKYVFGIPGVHTTEIYDELSKSESIEPILVTHEGGGSFMADAISRTSNSIGTLAIVPAAGTTHAASGIGEAYLDGVPMLVISGGVRRDSGKSYQLHQVDQEELTKGMVKAYFLAKSHEEIIPILYEAYNIAVSGEPGPVFVEVPANLLLQVGSVKELPEFSFTTKNPSFSEKYIDDAVKLLIEAKSPGMYLGWGAKECTSELIEIAELLSMPVCTTMQGLSVFPADNPFHTGFGFGKSAVPAAENAFKNCDCMLAIGVLFAELATGSYGVNVPENLIHVDINKEVFSKNFTAKIGIHGDAAEVAKALLKKLKESGYKNDKNRQSIVEKIREDKQNYRNEWTKTKQDDKVSPGHFFSVLREKMDRDSILVADDGNHTFLTAELYPIYKSKGYIAPTDYNAMGYCVPAAIGAKLANPEKQVVGIVGDGGFLMTGMELLTASSLNLGVIICIFNDGELAQISQFQQIPMNRKTCTVLKNVNFEGVALAVGAHYLKINNDNELDSKLKEAFEHSNQNKPVIVDVKIDYSKKTKFTQGVVKTNLSRFSFEDKVRLIGRAVKRHIFG